MRYIALLRGINVGGNTMIKMSELVAIFEHCGFINVVTYINSGNIAFDAKKTSEEKLANQIETAIDQHIGKRVSVMVREQNAVRELLERNPFDGQFESHKEMHVLFLREPLNVEQVNRLAEMAPQNERFVVNGSEIYCHLPMGVADSFLGRGQFEKKLRVAVTARNWRTVEKLSSL